MIVIPVSLVFLGKIVISFFVSGFIAMWAMWPINDQDTTATQVMIGVCGIILFWLWMFNVFTFSVSIQ